LFLSLVFILFSFAGAGAGIVRIDYMILKYPDGLSWDEKKETERLVSKLPWFRLVVPSTEEFPIPDAEKYLKYVKVMENKESFNDTSSLLNSLPKIDLSDRSLKFADLRYAFLAYADLRRAKFDGADLSGSILNGAKLDEAELNNAVLQFAKLNNANLGRAELNNADLEGAQLNNAFLKKTQFSNANLSNAKLNGAYLLNTNFNNADLSGAELNDINFFALVLPEIFPEMFPEINLPDTRVSNFNEARLNFKGANLSGAKLNNVFLIDADFSNTNLSNAEINNASFFYVEFNNANLSNARLNNTSLLSAKFKDAYLFRVELRFSDLREADFCHSVLIYPKLYGVQNYKEAKFCKTTLVLFPDWGKPSEDFIKKLKLSREEGAKLWKWFREFDLQGAQRFFKRFSNINIWFNSIKLEASKDKSISELTLNTLIEIAIKSKNYRVKRVSKELLAEFINLLMKRNPQLLKQLRDQNHQLLRLLNELELLRQIFPSAKMKDVFLFMEIENENLFEKIVKTREKMEELYNRIRKNSKLRDIRR
jgi:uncharacterized protein YjbI with pentapeptide repeats